MSYTEVPVTRGLSVQYVEVIDRKTDKRSIQPFWTHLFSTTGPASPVHYLPIVLAAYLDFSVSSSAAEHK